jgi:hypothetical protein
MKQRMQDRHLFEYAVVRVVPLVEREEFINVGVIVYSKKEQFLQCTYHLDKERLVNFSTAIDIKEVEEHLDAFERICKGSAYSGPIGKLDLPSRFRWLTATRSTIVQTSKVHSGFCDDLEKALKKIHAQLVLKPVSS